MAISSNTIFHFLRKIEYFEAALKDGLWPRYCTIGELADYVTTNVKRTSITIGDKMQTPKVSASSTMGDWKNIKLK